jgi:hypothetical protein
MFYARTPCVHVRFRLAQNIFEDVKHHLICTVSNGMNVLRVTALVLSKTE